MLKSRLNRCTVIPNTRVYPTIARFSVAGYNFIKSLIFQRSVNRAAAYFTTGRGHKCARLSHRSTKIVHSVRDRECKRASVDIRVLANFIAAETERESKKRGMRLIISDIDSSRVYSCS